ncbi:hypothetical protein G6F62_002016 [Rhizopus arrhizus]|nr:hypothetical protein G6F24_007822 [Rhizopus arrhizus]KAG0916398.1 hypothetical protein G6F33_002434 [Rhizopus arrhizus]KAG0943303.1 hypothetical protein G6F32_007723 [Rhizopus arrhizus]KAG1356728.1 hypothetical protein G6F62_002016 [Rhizopus arrhizus]KAG1376584.1 hypothetical protein G6F61_007473 [Rhizopus arrhizus]
MHQNKANRVDIKAPELYGWNLLAAANAVEYTPLLNQKLAADAGLLKLRKYDDIEDHPTMVPIALDEIHRNTNLDEPIVKLNPEHKSVSPFLSFWDFHNAYTNFETTPTKVAESLLVKLEASKSMNYMRFLSSDILQQAEQSTLRYKSKNPSSQLDGVFVAVKEEVDIQGLETKSGTSFINDEKPAMQDSTIVAKLKKSGAIVVGSTVMNELGWDTFTVNPNTGIPKNPYKKVLHSCGGSSGGCSGSVAAGLFPFTIGADGGGSIRIPSAFCGLYGLKTTWGRVSAYGGATLDPSLGSYGPIAATADDMAIAYSVIAGPDPKDPYTLQQPSVSLADYDKCSNLSDLTIAVVPEWNKLSNEMAILEKFDQVQTYLKQLGARIVEIDIPDLELAHTAHTVTICSEMSNFASKFSHKRSSFLAYTRIMSVVAGTLEARDYIRAQQVRTRMMNHLSRYFKDQGIDLILTPTTAILSPIIPEKAMSYGMMNSKLTVSSMVYAVLANLTGIPAVNIPVGYHNDLPIGLQFMASWWNEALLCRIAKTIERLPTVERERPKEHWFADNIL